MTDALAGLAALLERSGLAYALIGAHAVNAWLEPRFTADIDLTVQADRDGLVRLGEMLAAAGFSITREHGAELPSGPDFVRFSCSDPFVVVELQVAKTDFQREVIRRAVRDGDVRVATPEDLVVMKLIADRPKDQVDLLGLIALGGLDWDYIERWAAEWGVRDRLDTVRAQHH